MPTINLNPVIPKIIEIFLQCRNNSLSTSVKMLSFAGYVTRLQVCCFVFLHQFCLEVVDHGRILKKIFNMSMNKRRRLNETHCYSDENDVHVKGWSIMVSLLLHRN